MHKHFIIDIVSLVLDIHSFVDIQVNIAKMRSPEGVIAPSLQGL